MQTDSKAYISRDQLYEIMQRIIGLFETQVLCTKTYKPFRICARKFKGRSRLYKRKFLLENLFESTKVRRTALRKHATRHRPIRKQKYHIQTHDHNVFCMKTHKYLQIYTKRCVSRGDFYENKISTCKPVQKRTWKYTNYTKTCNALKVCSKTQIFYTKTYNDDAFSPKKCKYFLTKTYNDDAFSPKKCKYF